MKDCPIVKASEADLSKLLELDEAKRRKGQKSRGKRKYMDIITAFDIETTRIDIDEEHESIMYIWQWQIGEYFTVIGRTWEEFTDFYEKMNKIAEDKDLFIPVFVFNLSYEFQFLWEILDLGKTAEIFATSKREVVFFTHKHMYFACAYRLSNDNLRHWCKSLHTDHQKTELDYSEKRYPWTPLTDEELRYCVNDVICVVEGIQKQMEIHGDNIYSMPITSTGYIRRIIKKEMYFLRDTVHKQIDDLDVYRLLRKAYRGGNAHASNSLAGIILSDVYSFDRSSSYPDVMMHCMYPCTKFREERPVMDEAIRLIKAKRALLGVFRFSNIRTKPGNTCPYISYSSCEKPGLTKPYNAKCDNGRVVTADFIEIALTDIDLKIILDSYDIEDIEIVRLLSSRYGKLPAPITLTIKDLYKKKTELKGKDEVEYMKSKNLLNSVYGMMCQRAITPEVFINEQDMWMYKDSNEEELYAAYKEKAFLRYAWGVWVCAWARLRLEQGIRIAGYYDFVYCDTDSVKSISEPDFTDFNNARIADAKKSGAYATDPKGITHYMGVFEKEYVADSFITMGSKRYAYIIDGELHLTISGVNKKEGAIELLEKGGLTAFDEGCTFEKSGHIAAYYNDRPNMELVIDGHKVRITSNVCLVDTPYTLHLEPSYKDILLKAAIAYERERKQDLPYMCYNLDGE